MTKKFIYPNEMPEISIAEAAEAIEKFGEKNLTAKLARIEASLKGVSAEECSTPIAASGSSHYEFAAARLMKKAAAQINVIVHALGILQCLPHILEEGETIQYVSLGAGNTGKSFDLETDRRIAEFKFIDWKGGPESIRQNGLFQDFYMLAESPSNKRKYLYIIGTDRALAFFNGGRKLTSVLSKGDKLKRLFNERYGDRFTVVREYYETRKDAVVLEDVTQYIGQLLRYGA